VPCRGGARVRRAWLRTSGRPQAHPSSLAPAHSPAARPALRTPRPATSDPTAGPNPGLPPDHPAAAEAVPLAELRGRFMALLELQVGGGEV
jgi:hypothetical protein